MIHMGVLALPIAAFVLAVLFNSRHTPIGVAESGPPTVPCAILSVLAILTVCIGIPFFVVSTSATLLQKWFTYTGHPSARDPYFLYAASNVGSLISLRLPAFHRTEHDAGDADLVLGGGVCRAGRLDRVLRPGRRKPPGSATGSDAGRGHRGGQRREARR